MAKARFRGLKKVEIQFLLTATALNLKKMIKMLDVEEIKSKLSKKISDTIQEFKNIFRKMVTEITIQTS